MMILCGLLLAAVAAKADNNALTELNGQKLSETEKTDTLTLPVSICGQTTWTVVETAITLGEGEEERLAYELKDFATHSQVRHQGRVFYLPSDLHDRIELLLEKVQTGSERRACLIDNPTEKALIIHTRGRTVLRNLVGMAIRSKGPLSIYGEEKDSLDLDNLITIYSTGKQNRPTIEAFDEVSLQNLDIDMGGNRGTYGIRCIGNGKDETLLILNNVKGSIHAQRGAVSGFDIIEGTNCELEGVELTIGNEKEEEEEKQ